MLELHVPEVGVRAGGVSTPPFCLFKVFANSSPRTNRSCKRCTGQKRQCALTEELTKRPVKGKGKEKAEEEEEPEPRRKQRRGADEGAEPEWVGRLELRLQRLEEVVRVGLRKLAERVEDLGELVEKKGDADADGERDADGDVGME